MDSFSFTDASSCIVAGWGHWKVYPKAKGKFTYESPDKLQMLPLIIMKPKECKEQFELKLRPKMISKSIICARAQLKSTGCKVCPYKYCQ
jgi:hypothetical protein